MGVALWARIGPTGPFASLGGGFLLAVLSGAVGIFVLADDVSVRSGRMPGPWRPGVWAALLSVGIAQCVPAALLGAYCFRWLGHPRLAALPALLAAVAHVFVLPRLYPGVHLIVVCAAAVALAAALAEPTTTSVAAPGSGARARGRLGGLLRAVGRARLRLGGMLWAGSAAAGLASLVVEPGPEASTALVRSTSAVFAPWVLRLHDETFVDAPRLDANALPWYRDRRGEPARAPADTGGRLEGASPRVLLITIDCLRPPPR